MYGSAWAGYGFLWLEMRIQRCTVVSQGRQAIDRRILSALHGSHPHGQVQAYTCSGNA